MYTYIFESLLTLRKSYYLTYKTIISNNKKLLRKYSNLENKEMICFQIPILQNIRAYRNIVISFKKLWNIYILCKRVYTQILKIKENI